MKPVTTEKAVRMLELQNVITFETNMNKTKDEIKQEVEEVFEVKVEDVRTHIKKNKKIAYVKLNLNNPAIDIATKLGLM